MHIVNAMFGCGLGGIEQAFVDYSQALLDEKMRVTALVHPKAAIRRRLSVFDGTEGFRRKAVRNYGLWDIFAVRRLRRLLRITAPDAVIAHGNRAAFLLRYAAEGLCPVIGVVHNYRFKRMIGLDALFAITRDLRQRVLEAGQPESRIFHVPNMVTLPADLPSPRTPRRPPVIGAMGRFVAKKGFDDLIKTLALLRADGRDFRAVLAGAGREARRLKQLTAHLGLEEYISFPGWTADKEKFFNAIDIFCLPSLHEPFGIVLLEAWRYGVPVVTTDSEGPSEIITPNKDAWLVPKHDIDAMARALRRLLDNPQRALELASHGLQTVRSRYSTRVAGTRIRAALEAILEVTI